MQFISAERNTAGASGTLTMPWQWLCQTHTHTQCNHPAGRWTSFSDAVKVHYTEWKAYLALSAVCSVVVVTDDCAISLPFWNHLLPVYPKDMQLSLQLCPKLLSEAIPHCKYCVFIYFLQHCLMFWINSSFQFHILNWVWFQRPPYKFEWAEQIQYILQTLCLIAYCVYIWDLSNSQQSSIFKRQNQLKCHHFNMCIGKNTNWIHTTMSLTIDDYIFLRIVKIK